MDVFEWINIFQIVFVVAIFVICFNEENLRYLAVLIMFVNICWYPLLKVLTEYSPPGYGWVYIVAASIANYLTYEMILLRYHYSEILENRISRLVNALKLGNSPVGMVLKYVFPKGYNIRRFKQEYPLARSFKYISYFTLFVLVQYPVNWFIWHCDTSILLSCSEQMVLQHKDASALAVFVDKLYFSVLGENKYAIWDSYDEGYSAIVLFQLYVLARLGFQYKKDMFIAKHKFNA